MHLGDPVLVQFIRNTIQRQGPVTFAWFMEQALYHPEWGYYSSGRCAIGRRGDYFTNVSVGPLFGRLLAAQFAEMWVAMGRPADFVIVEQGAHQGDFAGDVLKALEERNPDLFALLRYLIIEPFPILEKRQRKALNSFGDKINWRNSVGDLEPFCGVHFSNELLDAMPVHLVSYSEDGWLERRVTLAGDGFSFVRSPINDTDLMSYLEELPSPSSPPYETEVNRAACRWIEAVAQKLSRGFLLTVDYGYPRDVYYREERKSGTLQCYSGNRVIPSPLNAIGQADVTAHVDWTSIIEHAQRRGLAFAGFADQHHFLTGLITGPMSNPLERQSDAGTQRALQTLLHPELLGRTFQYLLLEKEAPLETPLSGFRFEREPRLAIRS